MGDEISLWSQLLNFIFRLHAETRQVRANCIVYDVWRQVGIVL
jgi:hypothetical protein